MNAKDAAQWMATTLDAHEFLDQETAAFYLYENAEELTYINDAGGLAIVKPVLDEFRTLTPNVVWSRSERHWRRREDHDEPGRTQA
jgi:hypothetical protein